MNSGEKLAVLVTIYNNDCHKNPIYSEASYTCKQCLALVTRLMPADEDISRL